MSEQTVSPAKESLTTDESSDNSRSFQEIEQIRFLLKDCCDLVPLDECITYSNPAQYIGAYIQRLKLRAEKAESDLETVVDGVIDALGISKPGSQSFFWYIESLRKERDTLRANETRLWEGLEKILTLSVKDMVELELIRQVRQIAQAALAGKL